MPNNLVTNTLAVLAFVVGFYTLLARERKTPYITNFLFPPAAILFASIIAGSLSQMLGSFPGTSASGANPSPSRLAAFSLQSSHLLSVLGMVLFYAGAIWIANNIWRLHNRQVHFRDDNQLKNLGIFRWWKNTWQNINPKRSYAHNPEAVDQSSLRAVLKNYGFHVSESLHVKTIASCSESLTTTDTYTPQMAAELLRKGWLVQYTTCDRHPIEWIDQLHRVLGDEWTNYVAQLAVVDGYTPHFGFTDSIHARKAGKLKEDGVSYVATKESYAGVHSATAKAFNTFKTQAANNLRKPQFLIYEGCRALADLESIEQYRIFVRHVITSERMWGSMVTFFIEPEADDPGLKLMSAYADCLRKNQEKEVSDGK